VEFNVFTTQSPKKHQWFSLHFIGDVHIGQGNHNREKLLERIDTIKKDPHALWMGMGDYGDHIYYTDPRFDLNSVDSTITVGELRDGIMGQIRKICDDMEPIKDRCIGLVTGNHEETILKKYHVDPTREIAFRLNVPYGGYCCLTKISVGYKGSSYSLKVFAHHGYGAGRRHGVQINKIEDALRVAPNADIFVMGHVHGKALSTLETIDITERGAMVLKQKLFMITGSYSDTYRQGVLSYAEKGMFTQAGLGSPTAQFRRYANGHGKNAKLELKGVL